MRRFGSIVLGAFLMLSMLSSGYGLSRRMEERPVVLKLGFVPPASVLKFTVGDHRLTVAELLALKVVLYFGSLVEEWKRQIVLPPEYLNMYKTLETSLQLDPYNADVYYFSQAVFTWDIGRVREVNRFLDYGIKHRTWDPMLPFFAGFNSAYFLRDYDAAAEYMKKAAEIANDPGLARLASRYYYESGRSDLALEFLELMIQAAPTRHEAELYRMRRDSLVGVTKLQEAATIFQERFGRKPAELSELKSAGILKSLPIDPYGGAFYLDDQGRVRSTSNLVSRAKPSK